MRGSIISRCAIVSVMALFIGGALGAAVYGAPPEEGASPRAADTEPNDNQANAVSISSQEVVEGSLMLSPTTDYYDYYKINVPYGMVLNASLYMIDYDDANPAKYDFSLYLYISGSYWYLDNSSTKNRWESVIGVQYTNPNGNATMYIAVAWGSNFQGGRYALSAGVSDAAPYSGGNASWTLSDNGPNGRAIYRLDPGPADDRRALATLKTPATGNFSLHLYNIWPVDRSWNLRNESWYNAAGYTQQAIISGCGGTWYAIIKDLRGNGTYTLTVEDLGWGLDNNNIPLNATFIDDDQEHPDFVDQGADWVDWWAVNVKANRSIIEAWAGLTAGTYMNYTYFNLSAYDRDLRYIRGTTFPYYSGPQGSLQNITMDYDGPVYFAVRATSTYSWGYSNFMSARAWYKFRLTLPNDRPVFAGPIPPLNLLEDQSDDSLLLSDWFSDPDNDTLSYSILSGSYHSRPRINATTGRINFTPEANWFGSELIRFRATDDGPGKKFAEGNLTVIVAEVNDPPVSFGAVDDITLAEDGPAASTPDVASLFRDVDDPPENLSYALKMTGRDTHPPNATLPMQYDAGSRTYRLGPARQFFGNYSFELSCTDRHAGTVPAVIRFNLTVVHRNHAPTLSVGVRDPMTITIKEHGNSSEIVVPDLFADVDEPSDYAGDVLEYSVTKGTKLSLSILPGGRLLVDAGEEQYVPGTRYEEHHLITAKDRAGLRATLNLTVVVDPVDDCIRVVDWQPEDLAFTTSEGKKEVFRITAVDPDTPELSYSWFLDGTKDRTQTGPSYQFQPDYRMGGVVHLLRVVVTAGANNATVEWTVNILDVNRLPAVSISQPSNFTKFKKGEFITFTAEARDEDGDNLTCTWRDGAGKVLGTGTVISTDRLEAGTQTVRLEVSDGKGSVYCDVVVMIAKPATSSSGKGFIPGFGTAAAVAAAASAIVAVGVARRRREG